MDSTNQNDELPECPECDRALAIKDKSQSIGEFVEWLEFEKKLYLCEYSHNEDCDYYINSDIEDCHCDSGRITRTYPNLERLLAEHFEIDLRLVEREKRQLLAKIRVQNENNTPL